MTVEWSLALAAAAFAGGAFGAAVGALQSFTLAGVVVVVGEVYELGVEAAGGTPAVDVTGSIGFGVVLGPHVAFGGGAAAVAYAARRGYVDGGFAYHDAKHVTRGLGARPDVLAVGGAFGTAGYVVAATARGLGVPTDPVALGVVVSALAHRLALGYDLAGAAPWRALDVSGFERDPPVEADGGRLAVEPWLPYQYRWGHVAALGAVVGALGGYLAHLTASPFLAFGLSVAALVFLIAGAAEIPVTHHMSLPASTVVLAAVPAGVPLTPGGVAGAMPLGEALALGAAAGLVGGLVGELAQRLLYAHADTHLDPPAASIVVTTFGIGLLALAGVLPTAAWIPLP